MATTSSTTLLFDLSTDANYQAFWGFVESAIRTVGGWTYVSQTGDANPASTATGSASTYPAFRCYSTTGGAQTWYVRFDFGHVTNGPSFKVKIGTTLDGSGGLGGQLSTQQTVSCAGTTAPRSVFISQASGRLMWIFGAGGDLAQAAAISLHVDVDSGGSTAATGIQLIGITGGTTWFSQPVPASGTVPTALANVPIAASLLTSNVIGAHTMTFHPILFTESGGLNPTPSMMGVGTADSTVVTTMTVSLYSVTRTFIIASANNANNANTSIRSGWLFD